MAYSFPDAAEIVLREAGNGKPMHYREITRLAIERGLISSAGLTPEASMGAALSVEARGLRKRTNGTRFRAYGGGLYALQKANTAAQSAVEKQNASVRARLTSALADLDPKAFERLIGQLLTVIGFEDVEVTKYSGDGGIDVRGRLSVGGVTSVQTAIQVKRWSNNVPDKIVRELRGGLSTQERGLIITLSKFTPAARAEAEKPDRVPISLANGRDLVELLIEHGIGVTTKNVPVLELDEDSLAPGTGGAEGPESTSSKNLALWPLPGGRKAWLHALKTMLTYVNTEQPTLGFAITWLKREFEKVNSDKAARSYWHVPKSLRLLEYSGEQLVLTEAGASYLAEGDSRMLLNHMRSVIAGLDEILRRLAGL